MLVQEPVKLEKFSKNKIELIKRRTKKDFVCSDSESEEESNNESDSESEDESDNKSDDGSDVNKSEDGSKQENDQDSASEEKDYKKKKYYNRDNIGSNLVHIISSSVEDCIEWYKFFVEKGGVKLNVKREDGRTELLHYMHNYPKNDNLEVFNYLINNNCDINATDKKDNTPIFYTCDSTNTHYMDRLLSLGCNLDILNKDGASPLIKIVKSRNLLLVQKLIENKANINFLDVKKRNALHWAVNNATKGSDASNELENYILSHGCDPLALDINNRTPLHYAFVKIGSPFINTSIDPIETVSNILAREKALQSINVRDNWGNTPLHYAS